jgi:hypothetical protein
MANRRRHTGHRKCCDGRGALRRDIVLKEQRVRIDRRGRFGHSRVGITLDLYSHVVEGLQAKAVELVDGAMAEAVHKTPGRPINGGSPVASRGSAR